MRTTLNFALLLVVFLAAGTAVSSFGQAAKDPSPEQLVKDLYENHNSDSSPFFQNEDRALIDKYFVKSLADKIWKDANESEGEVGSLSFDPLYNGQDTEITDFNVGKADLKGTKANVKVTFKNFGDEQELVFDLTKEKGIWKIEDINYGDFTLTSVFEEGDS